MDCNKSSASSRNSIGPAKRLKRDIRLLYRKAFLEYSRIHDVGKKNFQQFKSLMKECDLKFSINDQELDDLARTKGLINYWVQYDGQKTFHIKEYDKESIENVFNFKTKELEKEESSIYSENRTFSSHSHFNTNDELERERIKNCEIKCKKLLKQNGYSIDESSELVEFCYLNQIELPTFQMDDSIFSRNIDFDNEKKTFITNLGQINETKKSNISSINISKINKADNLSKEIPEFVDPDDIYFNFDKVLAYRTRMGKKQAKIKWSKIGGKDFKPTWENLSMVNPEFQNERPERPPKDGSGIVHFSDMSDKKETLKYFKKIPKYN